MKTFNLILCLAAVFSFSAPVAHADEDGAFCSAKGYLAYERSVNTSGIRAHVLRIVGFDAERGIYIAGEAKLNSFQVHLLACGDDRVEIAGWGAAFERYTIGLPVLTAAAPPTKTAGAVARPLSILAHESDPARKFDPKKDSSEPRWLWLEPLGPRQLDSADPEHQYFLVISRSDKSGRGEMRHLRTAALIQKDGRGTVSGRLAIYQHTDLETID